VDLITDTDVINNIVTSSAIVFGGIWAYIKFAGGHTSARRGKLQISPTLEHSADSFYLRITITFKNIGLFTIRLRKDMMLMRVSGIAAEVDQNLMSGKLAPILTLPIFDLDSWVNPQDTMAETVICRLQASGGKDSGYVALQVEARVVAYPRWMTKTSDEWDSRSVVFLPTASLVTSGPVNTDGLAAEIGK
jgi:hypothetical protein